MGKPGKLKTAPATPREQHKQDFLAALGVRLRALRDRAGITRKALAAATGVSERHLANLEYGDGNASVLVLLEVSQALNCSLAELIGDFTTASAEWLMIRSLLENRDDEDLHKARIAIGQALGTSSAVDSRATRIALIGLRGAGKSTLGQMLAEQLGLPFIELSRHIENLAGCSAAEIQDLYGANAYRRYERRALEEAIQLHPEAVIATPGGLVSDPLNFELLLSHCTTVWLQAKPQDYMQRVIAQGDFRPMAGSSEAMQDLRGILEAREDFYSRADFSLDTSEKPLQATYLALLALLGKGTAKMQYNA